MKENKVFKSVYGAVLVIFIISGVMLGIRLAKLHRGNEFYRQIGGGRGFSSAVFSDSVSSGRTDASESAAMKALCLEAPELSGYVSQLAEKYSGIAAWLQIPGTDLDYPVMLGKDNQYYLEHLPDGSENPLGSLFLDYRSGTSGPHFIIYGHNGAGGKMLGLLKQYESREYYEEHAILTLVTKDAVYLCPIFSVRQVEADSSAYQTEFTEEEEWKEYMRQAVKESLYPTDADISHPAGIVTLSTCTGWSSQRLIVQAVLPENKNR